MSFKNDVTHKSHRKAKHVTMSTIKNERNFITAAYNIEVKRRITLNNSCFDNDRKKYVFKSKVLFIIQVSMNMIFVIIVWYNHIPFVSIINYETRVDLSHARKINFNRKI